MASPKLSEQAAGVFGRLPSLLSKFYLRFPPVPIQQYAIKPTLMTDPLRNPFLPAINPTTKRYQEPIFSLRQQSVLFKLARQFGLQDTLPPLNKKFGIEKAESKKPMRGVLKPKMSKADRTRPQREAKRAKALAEADELIIKAKGKRYQRKLERRPVLPKNLF
ncbi:mitochondrial 54S ribosomal protein mL59 [Limtongia smithiae]|uniref:mitochondrial 54S ribosomal protein mL59 n=1 Tax=Limtongia smithiae TaxID=1125753 RepID=UPI0034CD7ABA